VGPRFRLNTEENRNNCADIAHTLHTSETTWTEGGGGITLNQAGGEAFVLIQILDSA
jgi:hypothetical protein